MQRIREISEEIFTAHNASIRAATIAAQEAKDAALETAMAEWNLDRTQTYEGDPETALVHYAGKAAFGERAVDPYAALTGTLERELAKTPRLPFLFVGRRDVDQPAAGDEQAIQPWYTSLALVENNLAMRSSVEHFAGDDLFVPTVVRKLGVVARTAAFDIDMTNDEAWKLDQPLEADMLPLYKQVIYLDSDGAAHASTNYFPRPRGNAYPYPKPEALSGIGWREIISALENCMNFSRDLHFRAYREDPYQDDEIDASDRRRFTVMEKFADALELTEHERAYITYLKECPKLTAIWPAHPTAS